MKRFEYSITITGYGEIDAKDLKLAEKKLNKELEKLNKANLNINIGANIEEKYPYYNF